MMPFWLCHKLNWIPGITNARIHLLDELWHLCGLHARRLDPSHLVAMNAEASIRFVNSYDRIFRHVLTFTIAQVEQFLVIEAAAKRPFVVEHRVHQFIFAVNPREGKCSVDMIHQIHRPLLVLIFNVIELKDSFGYVTTY
jgi:hypothetical protein